MAFKSQSTADILGQIAVLCMELETRFRLQEEAHDLKKSPALNLHESSTTTKFKEEFKDEESKPVDHGDCAGAATAVQRAATAVQSAHRIDSAPAVTRMNSMQDDLVGCRVKIKTTRSDALNGVICTVIRHQSPLRRKDGSRIQGDHVFWYLKPVDRPPTSSLPLVARKRTNLQLLI